MLARATETATTMQAARHTRYGTPEVVELQEIETPAVADDGVLVRVRAASLNRIDWYLLTGTPFVGRLSMGLRRPKSGAIGRDFAGTVEAVGRDVTELRPGDEVYGLGAGSFADYVCVGSAAAPKPAGITFEEAAAAPLAALTALQGLRDHGQIQPGQRVLINGASGGVGTFAVQIAKALGAEVTAVCSTGNVELARSLGADHVIDYTREDFTRNGQRYDLMFDNAGNRSWSSCRRVLERQATVVLVGGRLTRSLLGPLGHVIKMKLGALRSSQSAVFFMAKPNAPDLLVLGEMLEAGTVKSVIDRRYELGDVAAGLRYLGEGHPKGKVVITM